MPPLSPDPVRTTSRWDGRESLVRAIALIATLAGVVYLGWRIAFTAEATAPIAFWGLWFAEAFGVVSLLLLLVQAWRVPEPPQPPPPPVVRPPVDVYICTYDEPREVVEPALAGAAALDYPDARVHLLDDGRREEMRELAARYGATWRTRADNAHAKAGNINAALAATEGEGAPLLCVLDADHVPHPKLLEETVGYFEDPGLALVQTPHEFVNVDSYQHHPSGAHEQSFFFRVVLPGRQSANSVFWCGSGAVLRREALVAVGGVATETITEDYHTTLKMHRAGWRTQVHNRPLLRGLAPDTLEQFLVQRRRWATGNLNVLRTADSPLRARGLTIRQRLHYLGSSVWFLSGLQRTTIWTVLLLALFGGLAPANWGLGTFLVVWPLWIGTSLLAASALGRGHIKHGEALRFSVLTASAYSGAIVLSLLPFAKRFAVTPKVSGQGRPVDVLRLARLPVITAVALVVGALLRLGEALGLPVVLPPLPPGAGPIVAGFGLLEVATISWALWSSIRRRQIRHLHRVTTDLDATLDATTAARILDLTHGGMRLQVPATAAPAAGSRTTVAFDVPRPDGSSQPVECDVEVVNVRTNDDGTVDLGCRIVGSRTDDLGTIAVFTYLWPYEDVPTPGSTRHDDAEVAAFVPSYVPAGVVPSPGDTGGLDVGAVDVPVATATRARRRDRTAAGAVSGRTAAHGRGRAADARGPRPSRRRAGAARRGR